MFTLQTRDFLKGLLMAILVPVLVAVENSLDAGQITFNWPLLGKVAIGAAIGYLLKNFLTNDKVVATKILQKEADKKGESFNITPTKNY